MEYSSESSSPALVSENSIRYLQSKIQSRIENIEKNISELTYLQTFNLCDIVKEQILDYEDEPQLSRTQNNLRRIYIASELIIGICSIHDNIVDFAFTKIINDLLRLDKYKIISSKITHKASSNLKKEKYFAREAHTKLLKSLRDNENHNLDTGRTKPLENAPREDELEISHPNVHTANVQKKISVNEIQQILAEDSLMDSHQFNLMGDMTAVRIEPQAEVPSLNVHTEPIPNDIILQPPEISIREPFDHQPVDEYINQILEGNDKITRPDIRISGLSENFLEFIGNIPDVEHSQVDKLPTENIENQIHLEEGMEEWNLPILEPIKISKRKCLRVKTDRLTIIPNYNIRAEQLNKNIKIQRIQVFEGPPRILQSMSSEYLMKTSSFKRFWSQNVRSSRLDTLYKRNLIAEKKPVEPLDAQKIQERTGESKIIETESEQQKRPQISQAFLEEVGEKVGMRSGPVESGVLAELINEKTHPNISVNEMLERNRLMGLPVSRIASPVLQPPEQEKISGYAPIPSPRIQQLQGTTLESRSHSTPWFFSTKEKPPRAEFREFSYIRNKLHNYWSLFEKQGMEKSITVREFLLFEEDGNFANYLTILRIVDKLSIQRELFLEYKNGDILIKPFETPYITKDQLLLQGKEQIL